METVEHVESASEECESLEIEQIIPSKCEETLREEHNYLPDLTNHLELISNRLIEGLVQVNSVVAKLDLQMRQELSTISESINSRFQYYDERQDQLEEKLLYLLTKECEDKRGWERPLEAKEKTEELRGQIQLTNSYPTWSGIVSKNDSVPSAHGTCVDRDGGEETSIPPDYFRGTGLRRSVRLMEKRRTPKEHSTVQEVNLPGPPFPEKQEQERSVKSRSLGYSHKQEDLAPSLEYTESDFKMATRTNSEITEAEKGLAPWPSDPEHTSNMSGQVTKLSGEKQERTGRTETGRKLAGQRGDPFSPNYGPPNQLEPGQTTINRVRSASVHLPVRNLVPPEDVTPHYEVYYRTLWEGDNIDNDVRNRETPVPTSGDEDGMFWINLSVNAQMTMTRMMTMNGNNRSAIRCLGVYKEVIKISVTLELVLNECLISLVRFSFLLCLAERYKQQPTLGLL